MPGGIPKKWEKYLPVGYRVAGTRFLPFKVPLKVELCQSQPEHERFTPQSLIDRTPTLRAVIDLTNTNRYYNHEVFTRQGILYKKISIPGQVLPDKNKRKLFFEAVDQLCEELGHDADALIGVHCTHGLNRTGYLICKYMVLRMKIDPQEAIKKFEEARGYPIERSNYVDDIKHRERSVQTVPRENWRSEPRRSPLRHWKSDFRTSLSSSYRRNNDDHHYRHGNSGPYRSRRSYRNRIYDN